MEKLRFSFGKPFSRVAADSTPWRRNLPSAWRSRVTRRRFLSSSNARRTKAYSQRGSPSTYRIWVSHLLPHNRRLIVILRNDLVVEGFQTEPKHLGPADWLLK